MGDIKHTSFRLSFVIFDIRALYDAQTHMATAGVEGLPIRGTLHNLYSQ